MLHKFVKPVENRYKEHFFYLKYSCCTCYQYKRYSYYHLSGHAKDSVTIGVGMLISIQLCVFQLVLTILPAKSDSDVMFCLQSYQGLMIDRSLVY